MQPTLPVRVVSFGDCVLLFLFANFIIIWCHFFVFFDDVICNRVNKKRLCKCVKHLKAVKCNVVVS